MKIERAKDTYREIRTHMDNGFYRTASNRLYYACYYVVSALLLQDGHDTHTHRGIITLFSKHYIKTGVVSIEDGKLYRNLFETRQTGDYDEVSVIDKDEIEAMIAPAGRMITTIEQLIADRRNCL